IFQKDDKRVTVWISDGRVCFTRVEPPTELDKLGHRLVADKKISRRTLEQALEKQKTMNEPLGRTLASMGALPQSQVHQALRAQAQERILSVREWENGDVEVSTWSDPSMTGDLVAMNGNGLIA